MSGIQPNSAISRFGACKEENPWVPAEVNIQKIKQELPDTASYRLQFTDSEIGSRYRFYPGQFNMLYLPGFGESAISISSDPHHLETLTHTVRAVGNVTQALSRCQVGEQIFLRGPFGSAWPVDQCSGKDVVIAAGGLGLAPLRPVLYHIAGHREDFKRVWLLYGARSPSALLYADEFDDWRQAGIEVFVTVDIADADWRGEIGVVPGLFRRVDLRTDETRVLTCGPEIMMRFTINEALTRGVAPENISLSMERNMSCAMGFCGHCQLGPAFVCKDGPVYAYPQVEPYLNLEDL
jgi:NAD(P)H-flavin reductase